jgi:uncharacterized membrane protein YadS
MLEWLKSSIGNLSYFVFWIVLALLATLTGFQLHGTLIAISIAVIENPNLRPTGWSTATIHGLGRVFWLILGILWLGWVMFTEGYLREGKNRELLLRRAFILLLILGVLYATSLIILRLLS